MHSLHLQPSTLTLSIPNQTKPGSNRTRLHNSLPYERICSDALRSLRVSIDQKDPLLCASLHARTVKLGIEYDAFIGNTLLNLYVKCGQVDHATKLFDQMPHRTVVTWTTMISGFCQMALPHEALVLFCRMLERSQPNEYTLAVIFQACAQKGDGHLINTIHGYAIKNAFIADGFVLNALLDGYAKLGMLDDAELLLGMYSSRGVLSWTTIISGCVSTGMVEKAFMLFSRMQEEGILMNEVTILSMLRACSESGNWKFCQWAHGLVLKGGWCWNPYVINSLVEMYSSNGCFNEAIGSFQEFCFQKDGLYLTQETMANLVQGCSHAGLIKLGKEIHGYLIKNGFKHCTIIENSLMNMYGENEDVDSAFSMFTRMRDKDIISWNTMIGCFVKNQQPSEALNLFTHIHKDGAQLRIFPNFVTFLVCLQACSDLSLLEQGQEIHGYTFKTGLLQDIYVQNALVDMYAKSGRLDSAEQMFTGMHERDIGSWNSMIAAYGLNGSGHSALQTFADLCVSEVHRPNAITYVNILSACAHAGLVAEGLKIFNNLDKSHSTEPSMEHFACVVDLLGRSGRIQEAEAFIATMPLEPTQDLWVALLGASLVSGNVGIAERAANRLAVIEPERRFWRVALSNVYATVGRWNDVARVRREMRRSRNLRKEGGWSIINLRGCSYRFMVGDTRHPESRSIYEVLDTLQIQLRDPSIHNKFAWEFGSSQ